MERGAAVESTGVHVGAVFEQRPHHCRTAAGIGTGMLEDHRPAVEVEAVGDERVGDGLILARAQRPQHQRFAGLGAVREEELHEIEAVPHRGIGE